jgi:hypothetical protein
VSSWPRLGCRLSCIRTTKTTAVGPSKLKTLRPHYYVGWNESDEGNKKVKLRKSTHVAGNGPHGDCQAQTVFDYRKDCLSAMGEIPKTRMESALYLPCTAKYTASEIAKKGR